MNMLYSRFDNVVTLFTITFKMLSLQHLSLKFAFSHFHLEVKKKNTLKTAIADTAAPARASVTKARHFLLF